MIHLLQFFLNIIHYQKKKREREREREKGKTVSFPSLDSVMSACQLRDKTSEGWGLDDVMEVLN